MERFFSGKIVHWRENSAQLIKELDLDNVSVNLLSHKRF